MKKIFDIEEIGRLEINQNWFTGRFKVKINDKPMVKYSKNLYVLEENDNRVSLYLDGNVFKGFGFTLNHQFYEITKPLPWYIYVLALLPFIFTMVVGNISAVAEAGFYYVGGALGGAISGLFSGLALYFCGYLSKWWVRILVCLGCFIITFVLCFGIGNLIVLSLSK